MPTTYLFTLLHPVAKAEDGENHALVANKILFVAAIMQLLGGGLQGKMDIKGPVDGDGVPCVPHRHRRPSSPTANKVLLVAAIVQLLGSGL